MIEIEIYDIDHYDVMFTIKISGDSISSLSGKVKTIEKYDPRTLKVTGSRNIMSVKDLMAWLKANAYNW